MLMFLIKIHKDLPQGELLQREERLRKTFFVQCNLPQGKVSRHKNKKDFSSSFFSLWKLSLRQILMNFDLGHFTFFFSSFYLCVIYPRGRSVRIMIQINFTWNILCFFLSVEVLLETDLRIFSILFLVFLLSRNVPPRRKSVRLKITKNFLSLSSLCGFST